MAEYNKDVVLARYGKILAPEAAEADPEDDAYPSCGAIRRDGACGGPRVRQRGGVQRVLPALVATVAAAAHDKAVEILGRRHVRDGARRLARASVAGHRREDQGPGAD